MIELAKIAMMLVCTEGIETFDAQQCEEVKEYVSMLETLDRNFSSVEPLPPLLSEALK